jgi:predicted PurR-regulated permease PerM
MTAPSATTDATGEMFRRVIGVLIILLLSAASLVILFPFLTAIIWGATIAVTTWPMLLSLQKRLGGRRGLATAVLTTGMLLVFFVPVLVVLAAIVNNAGDAARWARELAASGIPAAPAWLARVPAVGSRIAERWNEVAQLPPDQVVQRAMPLLRRMSAWLLTGAGGLALVTMQFLLTAVITAILYSNGEEAAGRFVAIARRIAGDRGQELVELAGKSVRGVALGVVGTALIQTALSAIAMLATGVPGAVLLSGAALFLCLAQVGPLLVLAPATGWLYWSGHPLAGTVLLVVTLFATTVDNVIRPILIKRGAELPLLLVFSGVIGGMLTAGIIGIFVGPVILAVTWTLVKAWVATPAEGSA